MSIPAILNAVTDKLFFYLQTALNDELVIQAFGAFEVVVIGVASFLLLGRRYYRSKLVLSVRLSRVQWVSLVLLSTSVLSIELGSNSTTSASSIPIFPCFVAVIYSGFEGTMGVFTERILKEKPGMPIHQQNLWIFLYQCFNFNHI